MSSSSFELGRDAKKLVEHFRRGQFPLGSFNEVDCHDCNRGDVDLLTADALVHEPVTLVLELGRGRGISNLDKKARITRPAPLI